MANPANTTKFEHQRAIYSGGDVFEVKPNAHPFDLYCAIDCAVHRAQAVLNLLIKNGEANEFECSHDVITDSLCAIDGYLSQIAEITDAMCKAQAVDR